MTTTLQRTKEIEREGGVLCVMMIDIDYFKAYNDHYGHGEGDMFVWRMWLLFIKADTATSKRYDCTVWRRKSLWWCLKTLGMRVLVLPWE